jgi:hypothetical protein
MQKRSSVAKGKAYVGALLLSNICIQYVRSSQIAAIVSYRGRVPGRQPEGGMRERACMHTGTETGTAEPLHAFGFWNGRITLLDTGIPLFCNLKRKVAAGSCRDCADKGQ